jgi:hypothetical protein
VTKVFGRLRDAQNRHGLDGFVACFDPQFQPARRRVQAAVDRRFARRRFDAAKTVEACSGRLRDEIELDRVSVELPTVVEWTIQPTQASLWLRAFVQMLPRN